MTFMGSEYLLSLICSDPNPDEIPDNSYQITISTANISNWDLPSILSHKLLKIEVNPNRLIEESSYFRGLLGGSFSESMLDCVSINWNVASFVSVLRIVYGCEVEISFDSFVPLYEAALFFGVDKLLVKCGNWLAEVTSFSGPQSPQLFLDDFIRIWKYGFEHANDFILQLCTSYMARNFMWALSFNCFTDVPHELLYSCIQHPDLTVDSERHLSEAILVWFYANTSELEEWSSKDLFCQIRLSLLPLWFVTGKRRCFFFAKFADESTAAILSLQRLHRTTLTEVFREGDMDHLRVRLTKYTQKLDISGCPQITAGQFLLSLCPSSNAEPMLKKIIEKFPIDHVEGGGNGLKTFPELGQIMTFEGLQEFDISNCPSFSLESAIDFLWKSFPSLRSLKAAYFLTFNTKKLLQLVQKLPQLTAIDLTLDVDPVIQARVSVTASSSVLKPQKPTAAFDVHNFQSTASLPNVSQPSLSKIRKLILEGRTDITGITGNVLSELLSKSDNLRSLCLRETELLDDSLYKFSGTSLEMLDVSETKVSSAALFHIISRNPELKSLRTRGCRHVLQQESETEESKLCMTSHTPENFYMDLGKSCKLEELKLGWGFSYFSLGALEPAISTLRTLVVGLGGSLGPGGLELLPQFCQRLETLILYFQVISDSAVFNILKTLQHLQFLGLCFCLGGITSLSFKMKIPNLRTLKLERVAPWMTNEELAILAENCAGLVKISLVGCPLLTPEAQSIILNGWPGLTSLHLEECGAMSSDGVTSLLGCHALEDLTIRHTGPGIPRDFIIYAASRLPMLRKISVDVCDAKEGDFDLPTFGDRYFLSSVMVARCKLEKRCGSRVHKETLVLFWNSQKLVTRVVKERL